MAEKGDNVTLLILSNVNITGKVYHLNMEIIRFKTYQEVSILSTKENAETLLKLGRTKTYLDHFAAIKEIWLLVEKQSESDCFLNMKDQSYMEIKAARFDIAIVTTVDMCGLAYPYSLGIPYAVFSGIGYLKILAMRLPTLPSFSPFYPTQLSESNK